ncbi:MAG: formylglycine-generating enzyme family protein [Nitrospinaceae bacterium]|nr:formylglycine-generating enzyme family protein [Nitrospinaceae bacterium]
MVLVQSGEYLIGMLDPARGTVRSNEPSSHFEKLGAFYIDRTEVTVEQFRKFDPDYDETPHTGGRECPACPAMGIDWASAGRYCLWAGKRLPTEAEWEAAARGQDRTPWPWGAEFDPTRANLLGERDGFLAAAPVGSFPQGSSPSGVLDMVGNVWEWVRTPFTPQTPRADSGDRSPLRIGKGGGWTSRSEHARISFRNIVDPKIKNPTFGFRCVKPAMGFKKVRPNS